VKRRRHFLEALAGSNATGLHLFVFERRRIVADVLEPAFDSPSRTRGLLGRDGLADGAALVIAPTNAIHTFGMRFPIDVIYAARDGRVVKLRRRMVPWRISAALGAFAVIEMAEGAIDRAELDVGEMLIVMK
jgi:uncharacterized membrane protein (UPF0127 family)